MRRDAGKVEGESGTLKINEAGDYRQPDNDILSVAKFVMAPLDLVSEVNTTPNAIREGGECSHPDDSCLRAWHILYTCEDIRRPTHHGDDTQTSMACRQADPSPVETATRCVAMRK